MQTSTTINCQLFWVYRLYCELKIRYSVLWYTNFTWITHKI